MHTKRILLFGLLLVVLGLTGCEYNSLEEEEPLDELLLIPKEQSAHQKAKSASNQNSSLYYGLISTLADDEAEYNY